MIWKVCGLVPYVFFNEKKYLDEWPKDKTSTESIHSQKHQYLSILFSNAYLSYSTPEHLIFKTTQTHGTVEFRKRSTLICSLKLFLCTCFKITKFINIFYVYNFYFDIRRFTQPKSGRITIFLPYLFHKGS